MDHIDKKVESMQSFITPLNVNGLKGRVCRVPSQKAPHMEVLLVYGHHAAIERMFGLVEVFQDYGNVTLPDLPGFGGMDSFYSVGITPSIDALADYLATFVKLKYRRKKCVIVGMSLGFAIATRMLQKYPELQKNVVLLVSLVGFSRYDDTKLSKGAQTAYKTLAQVFKHRLTSSLFYHTALQPKVIKSLYGSTPNAKKKLDHLSREDRAKALEFEVFLWRANDVRTYMIMILEMLSLDNCGVQVNVPLHHVSVANDQYFDNTIVEQHMRVIFDDYSQSEAVLPNHAPSIVASKAEAAPFVPKKLRQVLAKVSHK